MVDGSVAEPESPISVSFRIIRPYQSKVIEKQHITQTCFFTVNTKKEP